MAESTDMHERRRVFVIALDMPADGEVIDAWVVADELPAEWGPQVMDARMHPEDAKKLLDGADL